MSGGGPLPPLSGGEFLLSLLQNSHQSIQQHSQFQHQHHHQQQQQQQHIPLDPAVAALGPVALNGHNRSQVPPDSLVRGFNQAPSWYGHGQRDSGLGVGNLNIGSLEDAVGRGLGIPSNNRHHQQQQQSQKEEAVLRFGSFSAPIQHREGLLNGNSVNTDAHRNRNISDLDRNGVDRNRHGPSLASRVPPPGFNGGSRREQHHQNVSFGERMRSEASEGSLAGSRILGSLGLSGQLDHPGPPAGSKMHSVDMSDVEESMRLVHREAGPDRRRGVDLLDDDEIEELNRKMADSLGTEDDGVEDNEKKVPKNREKDVRSDTRGNQQLSQRMRIYKRQIECRGDIVRLNAPLIAIYDSLIPTEEEKAKQKQLLCSLERLVIREWPDAKLFIYGSCANSFGVSKSDIDICFALEGADDNKPEILLRLAEILEADNLKNVQALVRARVPIVKLMDPVTDISCDICINNVLAVVNTKLLRDYARIDIRLRQLAFIVKHWAKSRGVNETYHGTLSSYAYVLMCIHFLQQRRPAILPCLQGMKTTYYVTIENVHCAFFDRVDELRDFGRRNNESISQLVWAFFNYWAYVHDYANSVISVRMGRTISKRAKDWTRRVGNDRHLICIEDPFETSHDLGRVVDKFSIKVLREEFERAAEVLQHDPNPCVKLFEPYVPR